MDIKRFSDTILLPTKRDVLRVHLYFKLIQHGIKPAEHDMDIIIELYLFGGYNTSTEQKEFIDRCIDKKYRKTAQSVRNTLSEYVALGVFKKPRNKILHIDNKFIHDIKCDKLILQHTISHAE